MKILNFGSLNIDKVYKVPHFVRPGETISSENYQCFPGGKGLNQSIAAARAGQQVYHAGCVGADGDFLTAVLEKAGVNIDYVKKTDTVTGHALIQVSSAGENCIILFGGSNQEISTEYIDEVLEHFAAGDILILQNEISNMAYLLQRGYEKGMQIMLNPSPMDAFLKNADLSGITWLMLNETEGQDFTGEAEPDKITAALLQKYPELKIVLTLGGDGAVYCSKEEKIHQPCYPANVVDTTAAGDTFTGYFAAAMVEGKTPAEALKLAACAAAITVSGEGASVSIPVRSVVEEQI